MARKPGPSNTAGRNARMTNAKKVNATPAGSTLTMEDVDPIMQPSQSSSDDGMMATIAQQMHATMEKKKKEKETKFLQAAQVELNKVLTEKAHEFADGVAEMEKIYTNFQDAYAVNEDKIRGLWDAILKEQIKLQALAEEKQKMTLEREKRREKEHIQALAHGRKACEESQRLIESLSTS